MLSTTKPTAAGAIRDLVDAGVLTERTGRKRDRLFGYSRYLDALRVDRQQEA